MLAMDKQIMGLTNKNVYVESALLISIIKWLTAVDVVYLSLSLWAVRTKKTFPLLGRDDSPKISP